MSADMMGRVLLVDDDPAILRACGRILKNSGWVITTAADGVEAQAHLKEGSFEVIVSDLSMPGMSGIELLRAVRERDLDVPVILMTGDPHLNTAMKAVEFGAFRYLAKPVPPEELRDAVQRAARLHRMAVLKRESLRLLGQDGMQLGDRAGQEIRFQRALDSAWMAYQPIVLWRDRRLFGYEALLRSAEPTLARPDDFIGVAERLGRLNDIGRMIRQQVAATAQRADGDIVFFINLHSRDLTDDELFDPKSPLAGVAERVILEITERASLVDVRDPRGRVQALRSLGFRIAVDDLGAGYAGLSSFTQIEPEVVKLDMSLVRGIDGHTTKKSVVRSMIELCRDLGIRVVGEGVETHAERDALEELGCELQQGYLFARPAKGLEAPTF